MYIEKDRSKLIGQRSSLCKKKAKCKGNPRTTKSVTVAYTVFFNNGVAPLMDTETINVLPTRINHGLNAFLKTVIMMNLGLSEDDEIVIRGIAY